MNGKNLMGRRDGEIWVKDIQGSPWINAGCTSLDYSKEPEDNGKKINIGKYVNTGETSDKK